MLRMINQIAQDYGVIIAFIGLLGIEISPVKINPLKWIFGQINKIVFGSINERFDKIDSRLEKLEEDGDFKDIQNIKNQLCQYKAELETKSLDEHQYNRCFELIDRYEYYQLKYPNKVNGHLQAVVKVIKTNYENGNIIK